MIPLATRVALVLALWSVPASDGMLQGRATYYSPGLMETVARNRGYELAGYAGGVALNRAGDLGRVVWLEWGDGMVQGPFLVVDCAQRGHYLDRLDAGYVVEVDARVAMERGFYGVGPVAVKVWFTRPAPWPEGAM